MTARDSRRRRAVAKCEAADLNRGLESARVGMSRETVNARRCRLRLSGWHTSAVFARLAIGELWRKFEDAWVRETFEWGVGMVVFEEDRFRSDF